ncbi:sugar ABC transporter permease [Actinocatenispora thailandica]|uniref:Sugar ABC transporter permease n=1 Tax=Actinocatenispora thailandica TaxID=227318 RepID=A0A7R7DMP0_9ACTN|nr:carbohydrate ABC transporter permease [Actinocatenispora thailandica]BCJ34376.1 sugar ABC transporter permease [Actinocatenispora thailandica]
MATLTVPEAPIRTAPAKAPVDPRHRAFTVLCVVVLVVFAALWLVPMVWAVDTSIRPESEITTAPATWWTSHPTLDAYRQVLSAGRMPVWYLNSFLVALLTAVFAVVVCSMAGFAVARVRFRGRRIVTGLVLAGLLIPPQTLIMPQFQEFAGLHLLNTYWALILPSVPTSVAVFVFASFFAGLPGELAESARIDGAGWFRVYSRIFLPLCRPAASAVFIFTFVWSWNNFLWPLLTMTSTEVMTIPVGLNVVQDSYGIRYAQVMASAVLGALPLFAVFLVVQRRIVEGIANTGIK